MIGISWADTALDDLRAIRARVAKGAPSTADRFILGLVSAADVLAKFPTIRRLVPEADLSDIREISYHDYRKIDRFETDCVTLVAVIHGSRDLSRFGPRPWEVVE